MDQSSESLKEVVRAKYDQIARGERKESPASCCGSNKANKEVYSMMADDYTQLEGYAKEADLGLGCGLPTQFAKIAKGDTVLDLGSGAGNDCFVARHEVGAEGKVIGVDFTPSMINKARQNAEKLGYNNVEFRQGDIDDLPVSEDSVDVVVSNCVLNLVPDKPKVISEIMRVLQPGGHFSVSDIVLVGELPDALRQEAEMYAGCVAGAIQKKDYLGIIEQNGFEQIEVQKEKVIDIPDDVLERYLSESEIEAYRKSNIGIFSITVFARKAGEKPEKPSRSEAHQVIAPTTGCC